LVLFSAVSEREDEPQHREVEGKKACNKKVHEDLTLHASKHDSGKIGGSRSGGSPDQSGNIPRRASILAGELQGGNDVSLEENGVLIGPDEGAYLPVLDIMHKVTAEASGGSLKIEEWGLPSGEMIPPHTHAREDECSYVLEGELTCYVGGQVVVAPQGSYVVKPRGVPHAFYNAGAEVVRVMEILTPGDSFEGYFDAYEEIASRGLGDEEHREERSRLGERFGITWHDESIPEVKASFGIDR
jgi:quercetin dioxygenase-like cupin family protein